MQWVWKGAQTMARPEGKLVVFEGGDGSGKTEASKYVVEMLTSRGIQTLWTREPGGSPFAEQIRSLILSEDAREASGETLFHLFCASRADHIARVVIPALASGVHVISDRMDASTYGYQLAGYERWELESNFWLFHCAHVAPLKPTYLFFDVEPEVGLMRTTHRGDRNHLDERDIVFHSRVRNGFRRFGQDPGVTMRTINAHLPQESVFAEALRQVERVIAG